MAWEVAAALGAPLDAFVVRKLGAPGHEEFAVGALASDGRVVVNDDVLRALRDHAAAAARCRRTRRARTDPARSRIPRRPPPGRRGRQDRDPRRRRSRHRRQHVRRGAGTARSRPGRDRDRGARGSGVDLSGVRRPGRRRRLRDDADTVSRGRRVVLGFQSGQRRGGARATGHADHRRGRPADDPDRRDARGGDRPRRRRRARRRAADGGAGGNHRRRPHRADRREFARHARVLRSARGDHEVADRGEGLLRRRRRGGLAGRVPGQPLRARVG